MAADIRHLFKDGPRALLLFQLFWLFFFAFKNTSKCPTLSCVVTIVTVHKDLLGCFGKDEGLLAGKCSYSIKRLQRKENLIELPGL